MIPVALDSSVPGARAEAVVAPAVVAAVAARVAVGVPGVVRVEPGVGGLLASALRTARQRVRGLSPATTEGVRVSVAPAAVRVEVDVAVRGQALAVGEAVRVAVAAELVAVTGVVAVVTVRVLDIELAAGAS